MIKTMFGGWPYPEFMEEYKIYCRSAKNYLEPSTKRLPRLDAKLGTRLSRVYQLKTTYIPWNTEAWLQIFFIG